MEKDKFCPIAKDECLREFCMWYILKKKQCSIYVIARSMIEEVK